MPKLKHGEMREHYDITTLDVDSPDAKVWHVEMIGEPTRSYDVTQMGEAWYCECKGFEHRKKCKHVAWCKDIGDEKLKEEIEAKYGQHEPH